jgi:hypothetical protein
MNNKNGLKSSLGKAIKIAAKKPVKNMSSTQVMGGPKVKKIVTKTVHFDGPTQTTESKPKKK